MSRQGGTGRVFQVVEDVKYGDSVAAIAERFARLLANQGCERRILCLRVDAAMRDETAPLGSVSWTADDALIVHVWGKSELENFLRTFPGRKAMYFHNITPPTFFEPGTAAWKDTSAGWQQLPRLASLMDTWLAPSAYNLAALADVGGPPRRPRVIPPPIDPAAERERPVDPRRLGALRARDETNFLCVGRLAPNKRQDLVMEVFDYYHTRINRRSRLHLVGEFGGNGTYARALAARRQRLASRGAIEMPGKVSNEALQAHYRAADVFLSLSEHEGLCLPPLIAMAHGIPVLVRAAAALPETVGPGSVLLHDDDPRRIAELAHVILEDGPLRARLIEAGKKHLERHAPETIGRMCAETLCELQEMAPFRSAAASGV